MTTASRPHDVRATLTDVGHTAVGFAALAARRALQTHHELAVRYEPQFVEARTRALHLVDTVATARSLVESTVDPLVDRAAERLPDPVQDALAEYRRAVKRAGDVAHGVTVKVIELATAVPTPRPPRPGATTSATAAEPAPAAAAAAPRRPAAKKRA